MTKTRRNNLRLMIFVLIGTWIFPLIACNNLSSQIETTIPTATTETLVTTDVPSSSVSISTSATATVTDDPNIEVYNEVYMTGIIDTYYPTDMVLIADKIIIKSSKVDPTGVLDSTEGIQTALDQCAANGGGTVFLPRGKYKVTGNIRIPSFVYLHGDYNDPDKEGFNGYYGTVIFADVPMANTETRSQYLADHSDPYANFPALFTVGGSAGAIGLTVYYPNQDPDNIVPYPFTFEIPSFAGVGGSINHMGATIKNVTLINAYKGICASVTPASDGKSAANEMIHLENIKGTALYQGLQLYNSSETGIIRDINFDSMYWYGASSGYGNPEYEKINIFSKTHGTGILVGDLEWNTFTNIRVSGYKIGVRLYDGLRRYISGQPEIYFIGQFYNLEIDDCFTGLRVDDMFNNMGVNITNGSITGSTFAINAPYIGTSRIKLVNVELHGDVYGDNVYQSSNSGYQMISENNLIPSVEIPVPTMNTTNYVDAVKEYGVDNTGSEDVSALIQTALDNVGELGGGVVYLKAGEYWLSQPLTIPENTELRGAASANTRDQIGMSLGTVILADYGYNTDEDLVQTAQSLITLLGDNAGVSGLRVVYPENPPLMDGIVSYRSHSYVIRAVANNNFVRHISLFGVPYGVEFIGNTESLDSGLIVGVNGTYYKKGININNVANMVIEECLSNASVVSRSNYTNVFPEYFASGWPRDGQTMTQMYDYITRPNSYFLNFTDSSVRVGNSFTFGSYALLTGVNSEIFIYNSAGDNLSNDGHLLQMNGGTLTGLNIMRFQGTVIENIADSANITVINRLSLHQNTDNDVVNNIQVAPVPFSTTDEQIDDLPTPYYRP